MKNTDGEIIYVGKSKKLKNRVTTYFTGSNHSPKTARMVSLVADFDYIVCSTEIEALTLENVLIKKHSPKYNIKLKDAKSYPYIKVTDEDYPRIYVTRERKSDKGRYFGPYQGASFAHTALETVVKIFGLYTCRRSFPKDIGKERPCIYRDMGRCVAPCAGGVSSEEYRALVKCAEWVLDGNIKATVSTLTRDMELAAEDMEFERAAQLRDSIKALSALVEKQKVVADEKVMRDVFAVYIGETESVLSILSVRGGALVNKNQFVLSLADFSSEDDAVSLIADYYDTAGNIPKEIMLDFDISADDIDLLSEYLTLSAPYKVTVKVPSRGDGRRLCDMALENAKETARQNRLAIEREDKSVKRLSELLAMSEIPKRIEAYDISNFGNESIFASMVVYADGKLKKSDYRAFSIKTTDGQDDYGSMREALRRRLSHIGDGSLSLGTSPDLILLDGGVGHVSAIKDLFAQLDVDIPVYGMVKDEYHKTRAITDGSEEISIAREMSVYTFVYNLQEEAHRFALKHSSKNKSKKLTTSSLTKISGIGEKKARAMLDAMPYAKIKTASREELAAISGISKKDADVIYEYFNEKVK
jgi:excinuclease ABC subunit C